MTEKIIESKNCKQCLGSFDITQSDRNFYEKISPNFGGKKFQIPDPTLCPDCRQQRRLAWRNERKLYKRKCSATGRDIISVYSPDKENIVYSGEIWWGDGWEALDYGKEYSFTQNFFPQFSQLLMEVPRMSLISRGCENSEYGNNIVADKDCYLLFVTDSNERCLYGYTLGYSKDCVDTLWSIQSEHCYESVKIQGCYLCFYCENVQGSNNCSYVSNCEGLDHCYFCSGINNKQYHFLNQAYSKDEYTILIQEMRENRDAFLKYYKEYQKLCMKTPKRTHNTQTEDCSGDSLSYCKNAHDSYDLLNVQDSKFCYDGLNMKDCYDFYLGGAGISDITATRCYDVENSSNFHDVFFSSSCLGKCYEVLYCDSCTSCSHCFACVGLKYKEYCIFNKQYTKEEYEVLIPKIINHMQQNGEWGEFFPIEIALFGYNETGAYDYYPLTKNEVEREGWNWSDYEAPFPKVDKIIPTTRLPEDIIDIPDDILNWAIECEVTKKPFRIIKQELDFYRKHKLAIPKRHPDQRHLDRMKLRNPRKLFTRNCDKCDVEMQITYAPERPETVYCERCYNKEIY